MDSLLDVAVPLALVFVAGLCTTFLRSLREPGWKHPPMLLPVTGLVIAPALVVAGASSRMVSDMKEVEACGSCRVMDRFVTGMLDTTSVTLATRHFRADSMPEYACYACHTGFVVFGSMQAKADGLQHWWRFVTTSWEEPIEIHGGYPNANCVACHPDELMYVKSIPLHLAFRDSLDADAMTCFMCHGDPHARLPAGAH